MKPDITAAYRRTAGVSASPVKLIVILYEQLIKDLRRAAAAMEKNDIQARSREVDHALLVLARLQNSLNDAQGGEISRKLEKFYSLVRATLLTASLERSAKMIDQQIGNLVQLREAWVEVDRLETGRSAANVDLAEQEMPKPPSNGGSAVSAERLAYWRG